MRDFTRRFFASLFVLLILVPFCWGAADDISRLYNFTPSTTIQSSQVNAEFNQIISTMNTKASRAIGQTFAGNNTFSGTNTHSGNNTFSGTNTHSGTNTFSGTVNFTGYIDLSRANDTSAPAGSIWHNSTTDITKLYTNTVVRPIAYVGGFNAQTGTSYTVLSTDRHNVITFSNNSAVSVTLPQAGTTGFTDGFLFEAKNIGAGDVTITPTTSTIDGAASITLSTGQSVKIASNNTNYFTLPGKPAQIQVVVYQDVQSSGTDGGTFTSGDWRKRAFNTEVVDETGSASETSDQITLPAGTYLVDASAPAYAVNGHILRLYNATAGSALITGLGTHADGATTETRARLSGVITVAAGQALELQHQCAQTRSTDGLGLKMNISGVSEVFAEVRFVKIR